MEFIIQALLSDALISRFPQPMDSNSRLLLTNNSRRDIVQAVAVAIGKSQYLDGARN